jgi:hypothetical protein
MIFIISYSNLFLWKAGTVLGFVVVEVWQKRLVIVIDIYPVRQTHPGKLNDG